MFPIGDDDSQRRTLPVVTYARIALNVLFFLVELSGGDQFIKQWAFIPARFSAAPASAAITILTSMFMHGGWMHIIGNMLYLWIFGDNVEDRMGHGRSADRGCCGADPGPAAGHQRVPPVQRLPVHVFSIGRRALAWQGAAMKLFVFGALVVGVAVGGELRLAGHRRRGRLRFATADRLS